MTKIHSACGQATPAHTHKVLCRVVRNRMQVVLACMFRSESYEAAMLVKLSPLKHTHAPTHPCGFPCSSTQYHIK